MSAKPEASVALWKEDLVQDLKEKFDNYPAVGILDIYGIPAKQFQQIRDLLRGEAVIKVSRKVLLQIAIEKASEEHEGLKELSEYLEGPSALVFTEMDPFKLRKVLEENRTTAPAKPGMEAPEDIVIPEGDTDFDPGPVVGELQSAGINARIQAGKVVVLEDSKVVEEGEPISEEVAGVLSRFDIEPREIGFELKAAYADGTVFPDDVLDVDVDEKLENIETASSNALKLALGVDFPTTRTVQIMIGEASSNSQNLAFNATVYTSEIMPQLLSKAKSQMMSLASTVASENSEALDEELNEKISVEKAREEEGKKEEEHEEKAKEEDSEEAEDKKEGKEEKEEKEEDEEGKEEATAGLDGVFE